MGIDHPILRYAQKSIYIFFNRFLSLAVWFSVGIWLQSIPCTLLTLVSISKDFSFDFFFQFTITFHTINALQASLYHICSVKRPIQVTESNLAACFSLTTSSSWWFKNNSVQLELELVLEFKLMFFQSILNTSVYHIG